VIPCHLELGPNSKSETRNSFQCLNKKTQNGIGWGHWDFGRLNLFRISDFGFRILSASTANHYVIETAWSHVLPNAPRGLALAREKGWLLAWDEQDWLYLLDHDGDRQAQLHFPGTLTAACAADDGSSYVAGGNRGEICWLSPDLRQRWARSLANPVLAMALDSLGQYLAVSDPRGNLHVLDRNGGSVVFLQSPRPFHYLAFVPTLSFLLACSNYGLIACFDLKGRWIWRESPVAHIGSLACGEDGNPAVVACFTEGLQRYSSTGKNLGRQSFAEACRLAKLTFNGKLLLVAGLGHRLFLLDEQFTTLSSQALEKPIVSLAFSALGNYAVAALSQGPIARLDFQRM
jgi:hypothetical protein